MPLIISALHFSWSDIPDCLARVEALGLDGVELSLHESFQRPHCTQEDLRLLSERRPAQQLSAHLWHDLAAEDGVRAALLHWLRVCETAGIDDLVVHGGSYPDQRMGLARVRGVFTDVLPAFAAAGVTLHLENHYAYTYRDCQELFSTPDEFADVLSLDSPALRCCFDTGHGHMTRNSVDLIRAMGDRLDYVHLADNRGIDDDHLMYRQGTVDWDGVFTELQRRDFAGTVCVEFPVRDNLGPFTRCLADLRQLLPIV